MTSFAQAIESALEQAMSEDERIVIFGEDVQMLRRNLLVYGLGGIIIPFLGIKLIDLGLVLTHLV